MKLPRKKPMTSYPDDLDPELYRRLIESRGGALTDKMGIEFLELGAERSVARMPVEGNTARSAAMTGTAPRKYPNGDAAMRSHLMDSSAGTRPAEEAAIASIGLV